MATLPRTMRALSRRYPQQCLPQQLVSGRRQHSIDASTISELTEDLPYRELPPTFEDISSTNSYRLSRTLSDFLPATFPSTSPLAPPSDLAQDLPLAHHLVYFEPSRPEKEMLADGTNPDHSPGAPFHRRMWAGGRVAWNPDGSSRLRLDGSRGVCAEFIRSATIKGAEGQEKIFVEVERRMARASPEELSQMKDIVGLADSRKARQSEHNLRNLEHRVRQRLWRDKEEDFGPCAIVETRNIVFMRDSTPASPSTSTPSADPTGTVSSDSNPSKPKRKLLQSSHEPLYSHTLVPTPQLLFRFSALTFNAHKIHLDPSYARDVEGFDGGLLLHGPLSLVLTLTLLQHHLREVSSANPATVRSLEYRNLAPLFAGQEATFCGTQTGENRWEVWTSIGGGEGGLAIKGTVRTD